MSQILPWLVVLIYIVPIIGTIVSMRRRANQIWSFGKYLRAFLPEDRVYRRIKVWEARYEAWKGKHPLSHYLNLDLLNRYAGKLEYLLGHTRDYTIGLYMMGAFVFNLTLMVIGDANIRADRFTSLFYYGFFALLTLWTYRRHVATGLQMTEFMRANPNAHPGEFFEHYYRRLGPSAVPVPAKAIRIVDPTNVSYLSGKKPKQGYWPLLRGVLDTTIFARSTYKALETLGPEYGREIHDVIAPLWGSRILQLFRSRLIVEGVEKFHSLPGKVILVFNHKSLLDFALNFFALSSTHLGSGRNIRPRYMAAKDHFVDNKFVYSGVGVGKTIEAVDTIFVDRKGKGKLAILDACRKLAGKEIEIAMYPQGTRAPCNVGANGERLDAGFYTTGTATSLKKELGHLKKGCAFLAIDTAIALKERAIPVHLVFIGIDGTATLLPKGSSKIQTEGTVKFTVGDIFTLNPSDVEGLEKPAESESLNEAEGRYLELVERLQREINRGLVRALNLHEKLRNRFIEEIKKRNFIPRESLLLVNHRLAEADRNENLLPYQILDRIYALPNDEQPAFLKELARYLAGGQDLLPLRDRVTDQMFRHRGKELKTIVRQEKAKKVS
jgi:1-acyl-sn-glycerol-3-phosphate acyltransferase